MPGKKNGAIRRAHFTWLVLKTYGENDTFWKKMNMKSSLACVVVVFFLYIFLQQEYIKWLNNGRNGLDHTCTVCINKSIILVVMFNHFYLLFCSYTTSFFSLLLSFYSFIAGLKLSVPIILIFFKRKKNAFETLYSIGAVKITISK